jgi:hypothetical protein
MALVALSALLSRLGDAPPAREQPSLPHTGFSIPAIVMRSKSGRCREIRMEKCSTSETSASSGKNRWEQPRLSRSVGGIEDKLKNLTTGAAVTVETNPGNWRVVEYLILVLPRRTAGQLSVSRRSNEQITTILAIASPVNLSMARSTRRAVMGRIAGIGVGSCAARHWAPARA